MSNEQTKAIELLITMAKMNLLSEQIEMIKGDFKHKIKQDLNAAFRLLDKGLEKLKGTLTEDQLEMLNNMTDVYHAQSDSIRKQMAEYGTK